MQLDEGKDRIDLLALNKAANLVVIELERDLVGGLADLRALRYAAQVSPWTHEDVGRQAEGCWKSLKVARGTFAQESESSGDARNHARRSLGALQPLADPSARPASGNAIRPQATDWGLGELRPQGRAPSARLVA